MNWEDAYDEFLVEMHSRPSQVFGWFNHHWFSGKYLVNYSYLTASYHETH